MAADTAYLEGGPCDGVTRKITAAESDSGTIDCKGGEYLNDNGKQRPNGDIIFKYNGPVASSGNAVKAARAHGGWADLRHSLNHDWPRAMRAAERNQRAALRSLSHSRKVKR